MKTFHAKKNVLLRALLLGALAAGMSFGEAPTGFAAPSNPTASFQEEKLDMTNAWDKVFPESKNVTHEKVTFHNRYGIMLAADVYKPKNAAKDAKLAAIAVAGPFGAVKEQSSGLYAQTMAEHGFLTVAFDPLVHGRERRQRPRRGVARHQHGRFLGCGRLSLEPRGCGRRPHRHYRHLRLGRHRHQ